jgi:hypothetical protein
MRENSIPSSLKTYKERIRKIIEAHVDNRIEMHPAPTSLTKGAADLMEQLRLSLAQIERKKPDANPSKKPVHKTLSVMKKKSQRERA